MTVVEPLGQGWHSGLAKLALPPGENVPLPHSAQSGRPPKPGRHTGQLSEPGSTDVDSTGQAWQGGRSMVALPPRENESGWQMVHLGPP